MSKARTITNPGSGSSLSSSTVKTELQTLENSIVAGPSFFGVFGGTGVEGNLTISSATDVSSIDNADRAGVIQAVDFTIQSGKTLTVDTGWLFLGVTGTLTITGTIDADGKGEEGADANACDGAEAPFFGQTLPDESDTTRYKAIPICLSGAGGGGAGITDGGTSGGAGGGAGGEGGLKSTTAGNAATATPTAKIIAFSQGTGGNSVLGYSHYGILPCLMRGAGGGAGGNNNDGTSGDGGSGGGVIYIECNELVFTGSLSADGDPGTAGSEDARYPGGGGGGGGAGIILIRAKTVTTNTGSVSVAGGAGGNGYSLFDGGAGASGFKQIITVL